MSTIVSRLDVTQLFCQVDDFCQKFEAHWEQQNLLPSIAGERRICHPCRAKAHKVFQGQVGWGKNSVGWHYGFKLHLITPLLSLSEVTK